MNKALQPFDDMKIARVKKYEREKQARYEEVGYDEAVCANNKQAQKYSMDCFLENYERSLSVKLACRHSQISTGTDYKWTKKCSWFLEEMNEKKAMIYEDLLGSAISQAKGYTRINPETGEIEVDAEGVPIRHGGNPALIAKFIGLDDRSADANNGVVKVVLDMGSMCSPGLVKDLKIVGDTYESETNNVPVVVEE